MEGMLSRFPFNLFDKRWYYQSIVSRTTGSNDPSSQEAPAPQQNGETSTSLAAVNLNGTNRVETPASKAIPAKPISDESEMRRVFERFDENKDGVICSDELGRFMKKLGFQMSEEDLRTMVQTVDDNGDGTVDFDEFLSLYKQITGVTPEQSETPEEEDSLLEAFHIFDKDKDGYISAKELQSVLVSLGMPEGNSLMKCQKMIASVDGDGNGQVDYKEFKKMMDSNALQL